MVFGRRKFRRTTSLTEITVDLIAVEQPASDFPVKAENEQRKSHEGHSSMGGTGSPREYTRMRRRRSINIPTHNYINNTYADDTAHFLTTCGLCQRRLPPGRDIFMYRGDTAYCSEECREEQMEHDEREEKLQSSSASLAKDHEFPHHNIVNHSPAASPVTSDPAAGKPGTLAAA